MGYFCHFREFVLMSKTIEVNSDCTRAQSPIQSLWTRRVWGYPHTLVLNETPTKPVLFITSMQHYMQASPSYKIPINPGSSLDSISHASAIPNLPSLGGLPCCCRSDEGTANISGSQVWSGSSF